MLRSPLFHFLLIGATLFVLQSLRDGAPETPVIEVPRSEINEALESYQMQMGRVPSDVEATALERQVIDDALWLEQAFALGLHEVDPVVRQRLLLNMRFLDGADDAPAPGAMDPAEEEALLTRAIDLGMDRSDTVVRRRLVDRVQAIVRGAVRARAVDEDTLAVYYDENREQWREPALLDLTHVYLSRDRRGEKTRADAEQLLVRLREESVEPDEGTTLGDPFLAGHRLRGASPNRLIARLGPDFASAIADARPGKGWIGPFPSAFGQHLVWIHDRIESHVPALEEIRKRVLEEWIEAESRREMRNFLDERRTQVEIRIVDDQSVSAAM